MTALPRPVARGCRGAAATGHPLATDVALEVFRAGGNAVDAAVAAAGALSVVLPEACGLGGDALFTIRAGDGALEAFNGSGRAPVAFAGPVPSDGAAAATVPGFVAGLEDGHRAFGRLDWARLWQPAVRLGAGGFPAGPALLRALTRHRARLARGAAGWDVAPDAVEIGTILRQPRLARTLGDIAAGGSSAFYRGPIAEAIAATVSAAGGALSLADLAAHETVRRAPLARPFRAAVVHAQPPVSQAVLALMALGALDGIEDTRRDVRAHAGVEAIEAAFQHRAEITAPGAEERLLAAELGVDLDVAQGRGGPTAATHTTAVATADPDGLVVSMVISVFDEFGSAALVPEGGFFLNNRMVGFGADAPANEVAGVRPVHTLSPLLVEQDARTFAAATPGMDGQVQTLTQVLDAVLAEGEDLTAALDRRRWRSTDGRLVLEEGFEPEAAALLAERGHEVTWAPAGGQPFGATVVAGIDHRHGGVFAAADLRREAWAGAC